VKVVTRFIPGELAIHPVVLGSVLLLFVNDHVLKATSPSWLTGKLSDVAGLIATPLLLQALIEVLRGARLPRGRSLPLALCCLVGASFTAMELIPVGDDAFRYGLGALQWPVRALLACELVPMRPVAHVADAGDLWTLPALVVAFATGSVRACSYATREGV